jgi:hypothetical protein
VTSDQIQQSKNLETEINKYLNRLLNCINKNTADIKTKLIKQSFSDNQTWFGDSTDRYKFSSALRNMYTFFGNNANDYLLDQILTSITIAITNDENANILFRRLNKDKKTYTLYVQHSGWGIRSYYGIPLPKPQNPFSGTIELVIYGIYAPLHLIGRKVLQGTVTKLIKSREFYFKELKKVVATTCVNDCGINPKNSGGKRRQIKSKRRLRKTARRRTTRSYRKK